MGMRLGSAHGLGAHIWRSLISALAVTLLVALGATTTTAASPTACRVQNTDTGKAYTALQTAVDAASKGDHLTVRGTCIGTTIIGKKLLIEGIRTTTSGKATLSGDGQARVIEIRSGHRVRMRNLQIVRGFAPDDWGGGILNWGMLTLVDVVVRHNQAAVAGAIYNDMVLIITGTSRVHANRAEVIGGGVYNGGWLTLADAATISGNRAGDHGGGVWSYNSVTLNDASSIRGNSARNGGGVSFTGGTLTMNDTSTISGNRARRGGGVFVRQARTVEVPDGGVYLRGLFMNDASSIRDNRGRLAGGGVYAWASTLRGVECGPTASANVFGNTPEDSYSRP